MKRIVYSAVLGVFTLALFSVSASLLAQTGSQSTGSSSGASSLPKPSQSATGQDQSSLGDYAKKIHKDSGETKAKPKVYDNDNLPTEDKLSVIGQPAPAEAKAPPEEKDKDDKDKEKGKGAGKSDEDANKELWKDWQQRIKGQKDAIDLAARELDVLQREYQLRAAAFYADAGNRLRNEGPWDKEDADYKQKIADKQKAVDDAKQKLSDMQEEARRAGVPSSMIE